MSDPIEAAISSSIASLPGSEASGTPTETPVVETPVAEAPPAETPIADPSAPAPVIPSADVVAETPEVPVGETVAPEDSLDTVRQELAGKRDNRIPYSRVTKIVENAEKKATAPLQAEIVELKGRVAQFDTPEHQNSMRALELAETNPEKFIEALVKTDPRYAKLLAGKVAPAPAPVVESDVEPDIQLTDGTLGYSADAAKKQLGIALQRQAAELRKEMDDRLKEYEPIREEHQSNQMREQARGRVEARLLAAKKWPGFTDNAKDIADHMTANKNATLHDAYIAVVIPKMQAQGQADETKIRQKIADEQKKLAAKSTGISPGGAASASTAAAVIDSDPVEAAIRASISGLK